MIIRNLFTRNHSKLGWLLRRVTCNWFFDGHRGRLKFDILEEVRDRITTYHNVKGYGSICTRCLKFGIGNRDKNLKSFLWLSPKDSVEAIRKLYGWKVKNSNTGKIYFQNTIVKE